MPTVTCQSEGCPNLGIPLEVAEYAEMDGEQIPITSWVCGGCGTQTTIP